jgi:hypothetical protein
VKETKVLNEQEKALKEPSFFSSFRRRAFSFSLFPSFRSFFFKALKELKANKALKEEKEKEAALKELKEKKEVALKEAALENRPFSPALLEYYDTEIQKREADLVALTKPIVGLDGTLHELIAD